METVCSSETLVPTYKSTRRYNPKSNIDIFTAMRSSNITVKIMCSSIKSCAPAYHNLADYAETWYGMMNFIIVVALIVVTMG
jgi:hypothetical protein